MAAKDYLQRFKVFEELVNAGKCRTKNSPVGIRQLYKLVYEWEEIGLIDIKKEKHFLEIEITEKGKEYMAFFSNLRQFSDF